MDILIQSQRVQQESKYNGLSNFAEFVTPKPSALKPSGDVDPTNYDELFGDGATDYAKPNNVARTLTKAWKAQTGFDTGSTLTYNIPTWDQR